MDDVGEQYRRHDNFRRVLKGIKALQLSVDTGDVVILSAYTSALESGAARAQTNKNHPGRVAFSAINHHTLSTTPRFKPPCTSILAR